MVTGKEIKENFITEFCIRLSNLDSKTNVTKIKEFLGKDINIIPDSLKNLKNDGIAYISLNSEADLEKAVKLNG